jgi:arylsulfatase A-like enzyme
MFVALVVAKGIAYGAGSSWLNIRFDLKFSLVAFHDCLFVCGWAVAGTVLLGSTRPHSVLRRTLQWAYLLASVVCVVYGIVNIWVYSALRMPLTYPLLMMAGDVADVRSSIASYVTFSSLIAIMVAPLVFLIFVYSYLRTEALRQGKTYAILAVVAAIYCPAGVYGYARWFSGSPEEGLAQSPHWAILRSSVDHWCGNSADTPRDSGPASYRDDFLVASDRPARDSVKRGPSPIKNVIVVVLESTGTQFLSVYGSRYPTTPNLEAEARNSEIYHNVYSNDGYTLYSMMPLLLSCYPGTGWTIYASKYPHIAGTTAAQVLHEKGYRTAFMTSQSMDYRDIRRFFDHRGFDIVYGAEEFQKLGVGTMVSSWGMDDPPMFDQLLQWIDKDPTRPFYVMAWTQQTHHPYPLGPSQQLLHLGGDSTTKSGQAFNLYLNNLRVADEQLGRLFAALRQRHLDQNTLVVITGDHGESFGFPHPWLFHGTTLYQEGINVPLILWSPALFHTGGLTDVVGAHIDLNPTIMDILGIASPGSWQGRSLRDPSRPQRAYFSCNTGNLLQGMRQGNDKFIYNLNEAREELYDLASDPTEQRNLATQRPDLCKIYRQRLAAWAGYQTNHLSALVDNSTAHGSSYR